VVLAGTHDVCTPPAATVGWRLHAAGPFAEVRLDAGHFFHRTHVHAVADCVAGVLAPSRSALGAPGAPA